MRWLFGLIGLGLAGLGVWMFIQDGMSDFLSGWGVVLFVLGVALMFSLTMGGTILNFVLIIPLVVTGIIRLFLDTGDWWHWVLLSLGVGVIFISGAIVHADDPEEDDAAVDAVDSRNVVEGQSSVSNPQLAEDEAAALQVHPKTGSSHRHIPSARSVVSGVARGFSKSTSGGASEACPNCGKPVKSTSKFCGTCGNSV